MWGCVCMCACVLVYLLAWVYAHMFRCTLGEHTFVGRHEAHHLPFLRQASGWTWSSLIGLTWLPASRVLLDPPSPSAGITQAHPCSLAFPVCSGDPWVSAAGAFLAEPSSRPGDGSFSSFRDFLAGGYQLSSQGWLVTVDGSCILFML